MLLVPMRSDDAKHDALLVILDQRNIDRMTQGDPAEIKLKDVTPSLRNPVIMLAFEKDLNSLNKFVQAADLNGLIKHLQRGWKFRPELGDHDRGPESISGQN